MLQIKQLSIGYKSKTLIKDINLCAKTGEIIAIVGKNGTGKSTLLKTLAREIPLLSGEILLDNKNLNITNRHDFAKQISFVSTEIQHVPNLRVYDLVALGRFPYTNWFGNLTKNDKQIVNEAISAVGLQNLQYKNIDQISDGERQRASIARAVAQDTQIILLDEPTAFLDFNFKYEIIFLLQKLANTKKKIIIFSSHDIQILLKTVDKLWFVADNIICQGAPEDIIIAGTINYIFDNENISFNASLGDFVFDKKYKAQIFVEKNTEHFLWLQNALNRINFSITENENCNFKLSLKKQENNIEWLFETNKVTFTFNTIYNLITYLKDMSRG